MERYNRVYKLELMDEAKGFLAAQDKSIRTKILSNIKRILCGEHNIELFKKLVGTDIWEFRTLYDGNAYRLFAFWDKAAETIIVATHGIRKKTRKTPAKEIRKAERIRNEYFSNKNGKS